LTKGRLRSVKVSAGASSQSQISRLKKPRTERAFIAIGDRARQWLIEAAAPGPQRVRTKMIEATELAALVGSDAVKQALGLAAASERFATRDLSSIVDYLQTKR